MNNDRSRNVFLFCFVARNGAQLPYFLASSES